MWVYLDCQEPELRTRRRAHGRSGVFAVDTPISHLPIPLRTISCNQYTVSHTLHTILASFLTESLCIESNQSSLTRNLSFHSTSQNRKYDIQQSSSLLCREPPSWFRWVHLYLLQHLIFRFVLAWVSILHLCMSGELRFQRLLVLLVEYPSLFHISDSALPIMSGF